jgi:hypothetical protein
MFFQCICSHVLFLQSLSIELSEVQSVEHRVDSILRAVNPSQALNNWMESIPCRELLPLFKVLLPRAIAPLNVGAVVLSCIVFHCQTVLNVAMEHGDLKACSEARQVLLDLQEFKTAVETPSEKGRLERSRLKSVVAERW